MATNIVKVVNIIEPKIEEEKPTEEQSTTSQPRSPSIDSTPSIFKELEKENQRKKAAAAAQSDEISIPKRTFSERFMRHFFVVIYLCSLCSLGFVLSIYHLFFWDSRMPPVYKSPIVKKPPLYLKP